MADQFYGLTDTGNQRSNNEDTFIAQVTADGKFIIACVIDGVGGYSGGEVAAELARNVILQRLNKPSGEIIPILIDCFNLANKKILDEKQRVKEHESMACVATLALVDIEKNQFYYAHVGDTRLYLSRDSSLVKITHDQSFVGYLEESRRITEEEAMTHPKRNEINKALGFGIDLAKDDEYIETGHSPFLPGDMLLLCSDGLTDMVPSADINGIISPNSSSLKEKCKGLIDAANAKGGADNITVVLVANNKQPLKYNATMPAANQKKNESPERDEISSASLPVVESIQPNQTKARSNKGIVITLTLLTLALLAGNVWQYIQNKRATPIVAVASDTSNHTNPSDLQLKLENTIAGLKGNLLILTDSDYTSPVKISRPINITRDTLFIKTKGKIELIADSGYTGASFILSQQCKLVMLDSLVIKNFKTGVIATNSALLLKRVRFDNCQFAVQNLFTVLPAQSISGAINGFKVDSIAPNKN